MAQSLTAVFYLPHLVAQGLGAFRDEGLTVEFVTSFGGQWALLEDGEVDLAIGGPTRNMEQWLRGGARIVNFCAGLKANTWFLIARQPVPGFTWRSLVDRTVLGLHDAPQGVCLRWLLLRHGIRQDEVALVAGQDTTSELEAFRGGEGDYLLHSLHTVAPLVARGEVVLIQELATPIGAVPWSTYAALPETLRARRADLDAFTRAIAHALRWIAAAPSDEVAARVASYFPDWEQARLTEVLRTYKQLGTWPESPLIPRADWERYCAMYVAVGALPQPVPYEDLVDTDFAARAMATQEF
jgi:NitT/TauT family transport system substrate-binding protein